MPQLNYFNRSASQRPKRAGLRPGQDVFAAKSKAAASFPTVGMTLRSYNHDPLKPVAAPPRNGKPHPVRSRLRSIFSLKHVVVTLLIAILLVGGFVGGKLLYDTHKLFGGNIFGVFGTTKLKGEDQGRVNILLAGNSADDPGHQGANLTDSIMLISIDTRDNKAFMLSIPRDLLVNLPGEGYQKINDAYVVGQNDNFNQNGYFPGGMGQLQKIVEQDLGVTIDYYALINYAALRDAVNAVGGIQVNIQSSDPRGLYDPSIDYATGGPLVKLSNGEHTLNGEQALDLARARGDAYGSYGFAQSDFERTANQRMMLVALKSKAQSVGVLTNPVRLTQLFDSIGNNVTTDFTLKEVHRLYDLTKSISGNNLQSLSLNDANGQDLLANYDSSNAGDSLIPAAGFNDFSQIQQYLKQLTSSDPVVQEGAKIVVLNATDTNGLAAQARTTLESKNFNVVSIGDALQNQATTTIIDNSGGTKPATRSRLEQLYGNNFTTTNPYSDTYQADFIVVLGQDQATADTSSTTNGAE